jgi:hypothetical protein
MAEEVEVKAMVLCPVEVGTAGHRSFAGPQDDNLGDCLPTTAGMMEKGKKFGT